MSAPAHERTAPAERGGWYLVYTKPRQENAACRNLTRQGYEVYLPRLQTCRRRRGRFVDLIEPLFPNYLFVRLDLERQRWSSVRSTIGVRELVRFGDRPARVPDRLIGFLRAREGADGLVRRPPPPMAPGARVRVLEGVFAGYEGLLQAETGRERVAILLEIAGRTVSVALEAGSVAPIR